MFNTPARIAIYSHDTVGLGHIRRNTLIAHALAAAFPGIDILLLTGARESGSFALPPGVDSLVLPGLRKGEDGTYAPRSWHAPLKELVAFHASVFRAALEAFRPDVLIVDKVPRGAKGSLEQALRYLKQHTDTKVVLGLRDILDEPSAVEREWMKEDNYRAVDEFYDALWVYGDQNVFAWEEQYLLPESILARLSYTGYLDPEVRLEDRRHARGGQNPAVPSTPYFLCAVGGGQDGFPLAAQFVSATFPEGVTGVVLTGPQMSAAKVAQLEALCANRPHIRILPFHPAPTALYRQAARVVSMGGYNTTMELVAMGKRPLVLPRIEPRREQLIRAEAFHRLGLLDILDPHHPHADAISAWFQRPLASSAPARSLMDMRGLDRIPHLVTELLAGAARGAALSTSDGQRG